MLQTIYLLNKEILKFLGLKSVVYNQERLMLQIIYALNKEILQKSLCKFAALNLLCKSKKKGWPQGLFDILAEICILHVVN